MKKGMYVLIMIFVIALSVFITRFVTTKSVDSSRLTKVKIFGNEVEIKNGNAFIFSMENVEIKNDNVIEDDDSACFNPVELYCANGKECTMSSMYEYDKEKKVFSAFFITSNKYPSDAFNIEKDKKFGIYDRYDYYIEIHDIDEEKVKASKYCLSADE